MSVVNSYNMLPPGNTIVYPWQSENTKAKDMLVLLWKEFQPWRPSSKHQVISEISKLYPGYATPKNKFTTICNICISLFAVSLKLLF